MTRAKAAYDELHARAVALQQQADTVDTEIGRLASAVATLNWMGQRKDRFTAQWDDTASAMRGWVAEARRAAEEFEKQAVAALLTQGIEDTKGLSDTNISKRRDTE